MMVTAMIQKVGQISVPVKDLNRAIDFYQGKLDLLCYFILIIWLSLNVMDCASCYHYLNKKNLITLVRLFIFKSLILKKLMSA